MQATVPLANPLTADCGGRAWGEWVEDAEPTIGYIYELLRLKVRPIVVGKS